jgi:hypothetical protein
MQRAALIVVTLLALPSCSKASKDKDNAAPSATVEVQAAAVAPAASSAPAATVAPIPTAAAAPSTPFVTGESWSGSYVCGQGPTQVQLHVKRGGTEVQGVFAFVTKNKTTGSFNMTGAYDTAARHLHLNAGNWVSQPPGFVTVNLDGTVSADGHGFSGTVQGPGCSTFSLRR